MGLFSSKKTTKSNEVVTQNQTQNQNQSSTIDRSTMPVIPDWIIEPTKGFTSQITGIGQTDPLSYVAGTNPLLDRASLVAGGLNSMPWNYDRAADWTREVAGAAAPQVQAASLLENVGDYESKYTNDVVNTALADLDHGAGMTRAQQQLDLANDATFGGSGGSILRALTEGELSRSRASTSANLRDQAWQRATALSSEDAARRQAASLANAQFASDAQARKLAAGGQLADLSNAFSANERANIGAQFDLGQYLRGVEQEQRNAPLTLLDYTTGQFGKLPLNMFPGEHTFGTENTDSTMTSNGVKTSNGVSTTKGSPSILSSIGQAAKIAATLAAMSDERLKTNVRRVGAREDGIGLYEFEYTFAPGEMHVGVMAQEVMRTKPEAVLVHPTGYLMVDYGKL